MFPSIFNSVLISFLNQEYRFIRILYAYSRSSYFLQNLRTSFQTQDWLFYSLSLRLTQAPGFPPVKLKTIYVPFLLACSLTRHHKRLYFVHHPCFSLSDSLLLSTYIKDPSSGIFFYRIELFILCNIEHNGTHSNPTDNKHVYITPVRR